MPLSGPIPSTGTTLLILAVLSVVLAGSAIMFRVLVVRSTHQRQWVLITEWGRERGLRRMDVKAGLPDPFGHARGGNLSLCVGLSGRGDTLAQLEGEPAAPGRVTGLADSLPHKRWNVLVRETDSTWQPTALRPTRAARSLVDFFPLTSFPSLGAVERFVVYGSDAASARWLSRSSARGLLPPDVGLLLHGPFIVLDFSARPFDEVEFNRMLVVAGQLETHLQGKP